MACMSFRAQFTEKIAEIRRAALNHFETYELGYPGAPFAHLNGTNTQIVFDQEIDPVSTENLRAYLETLRSDLNMLEVRTEQYLDLNPTDLDSLRAKMCRRDNSQFAAGEWAPGGEHWSPSIGPAPYEGGAIVNVADRIDVAINRYVSGYWTGPDTVAPPIWKGDAARAFNDYFLWPLHVIAARQIYATVYLGNVLDIMGRITAATQEDLLAIADAALTAFAGENPVPVSSTLSGLALMTSSIGLVLPPPWDAYAGVASVALDIASRQVRDPAPPEWLVLWSPNTADIVAGLFGQLDAMERAVGAIDVALGDAVVFDSSTWDFTMAGLAPDAPDGIDENLVAQVQPIYELGSRKLPSAAELYGEAAYKIETADLPAWFNRPFTVSWAGYEGARMDLQAGLNETAVQLTDAGEALVAICDTYASGDTTAAAEFREFQEAMPVPEDLTTSTAGRSPRMPVF
jgi:hypothetical protein